MSDLTDAVDSGVSDSPAEAAPPIFDNEQTDAILALVAPLLEATLAAAVEEARVSTPVPTLRPGTCRAVDPVTRSCQVLVDGDDETLPDVVPINAQIIGEYPIVNGRVMVIFSPPSSVHAISMIPALPAGMVIAYAGIITSDVASSDPAVLELPPAGFLRCYGQVVNAADYAALFVALGTTFNSGGEVAGQTFRLPDLRGRAIFGLDNMGGSDAGRLSTANTIGTTMGAETFTLTAGQLPAHTHTMGNHSHTTGSYAVNSHTHSTPSHSHSVGSMGFSGTTGGDGNHNHTVNNHEHSQPSSSNISGIGGATAGGDLFPATGFSASPNTGGSAPATDTQGYHTHSFSGSVSGSTNTDGSGTSGSASPGLSGSSGGPSTNTTDSTGSGSSVTAMPPGITLHWCVKY